MRVNPADGTNVWVEGPATNQGYLVPQPGRGPGAPPPAADIARDIDSLLAQPPRRPRATPAGGLG